MSERVQKFLANQGIASRRDIEHLIEAGEIKIDGKVCALGQCITGNEKIVVSGKQIDLHSTVKKRVLLYHKPCGEIVSKKDPQKRSTVFERLPKLSLGRWISIGRLDLNTSGLLLFTTDGALANSLMHPRNKIEREYRVRAHGKINNEILSRLQQGVMLEDGLAKLEILEVQQGKGANSWCRVVLREGRNREIRKLCQSQGLQVSRLIRTRYGTIKLPKNLKPGSCMESSTNQKKQLYRLFDKNQ